MTEPEVLVATTATQNRHRIERARIALYRVRVAESPRTATIPTFVELAAHLGIAPESIARYRAGSPIGADVRKRLTALLESAKTTQEGK